MAIEINVPDIGLMKLKSPRSWSSGRQVEAEQSLITVEGDKALWKSRLLRLASLKRLSLCWR